MLQRKSRVDGLSTTAVIKLQQNQRPTASRLAVLALCGAVLGAAAFVTPSAHASTSGSATQQCLGEQDLARLSVQRHLRDRKLDQYVERVELALLPSEDSGVARVHFNPDSKRHPLDLNLKKKAGRWIVTSQYSG